MRSSGGGSYRTRRTPFLLSVTVCGAVLLLLSQGWLLQSQKDFGDSSQKRLIGDSDDIDANDASENDADLDDEDDFDSVPFIAESSRVWQAAKDGLSDGVQNRGVSEGEPRPGGGDGDGGGGGGDGGGDAKTRAPHFLTGEFSASTVQRSGRAFTWASSALTTEGAVSILRRVMKHQEEDHRASAASANSPKQRGYQQPLRRGVDAIVVLCGGGRLPMWVKQRLLAAKLLHDAAHALLISRDARRLRSGAINGTDSSTSRVAAPPSANDTRLPAIVVSGGGSPHVGPVVIEEAGVQHTLHEATEGCMYLRDVLGYRGLLMKEIASYDTLGNAFFVRQLLADPQRWRSMIVLTSDWHMRRTILLFQYIFGLTPAMPTELFFVATPPGAGADAVQLRQQVEEASLEKMKTRLLGSSGHLSEDGLVQQSLKSFQRWMLTEHTCYDERGPRETSLRGHRPEGAPLY